jgi:serine/threonine protein phosphatase 1
MPRLLAIGDIHGCTPALDAVLAAADPRSDDTVVTMGDYVDRGPDSKGTIQRLIELASRCRLIPLLGNHDSIVLGLSTGSKAAFGDWLRFGGEMTLASYDCTSPEEFPEEHLDFLRSCRLYHESEHHFFVHASYIKELPLAKQPEEVLLWDSLRYRLPGPHCSGKKAIVAHTSQKTGEVLDLDYLKCIDTWVYGDGWLTMLDVETGQVWQANREGEMRRIGKDREEPEGSQ